MKIFRFDPAIGRMIDQYGSVNLYISPITRVMAEAQVNNIHLGKNGVIGFHQASSAQLFLLVQGQGWVRTDKTGAIQVEEGEAIFWEKDEWHETRTESGLSAIVIESDRLDPAEFMPEK